MSMKSAGGRIFYEEVISNVTSTLRQVGHEERGRLVFRLARAAVSEIVVGRRPIVDVAAFYGRGQRPPVIPFVNPITARFTCLVNVMETDALVITTRDAGLGATACHSLKHALLNAAPAVSGLTQDEYGAALEENDGGSRVILYDNVPGGTGGIRMLGGSRLDRWLQVARELAECHQVQCEDACRGCLFLPQRLCRQWNQNLDRTEVLGLLS